MALQGDGEAAHPDSSSQASGGQAEITAVTKRIDLARKGGKLDLTDMSISALPRAAIDLGDMLRIVWLSENQLTELPEDISLWKQLTQMRISNNRLSRFPDELGQLKALVMLIANDNVLTGLPETIQGCKALMVLDVRHNRIKRLPIQLATLAHLNDLQSDNNPLEFPHKKVMSMGRLSIFKYLKRFVMARKTGKLDLTKCSLMEIPPEIGYVGDKLVELDASDILPPNGMAMPFEVGNCRNLTTALLHPDLKMLSPPESVSQAGIQHVVAYLSRFNHSKLHGVLNLANMFLDDFPPELYDAKQMEPKNLVKLVLDNNNIAAFSNVLGMMPNLTELTAVNNAISSIPASVAKLPQLVLLDISQNKVNELSDAITRVPCLATLRVRANRISSISEHITDVPMLTFLDIGQNSLTKIPPCIKHWTALTTLHVDSNSLRTLPREIGALTQLQYLNLSDNALKALPAEIGGLGLLHTLLLSSNQLTSLPTELGNLTSVTHLSLRVNTALKELPISLADISTFRCVRNICVCVYTHT